jgi:hypothetical protein
MTTAQQGASGGGMFSKLVIVLLLAVTIGLYVQIVLVDDNSNQGQTTPRVSVQVIEGDAARVPATAAAPQNVSDDQMQLIRQVFAPELH